MASRSVAVLLVATAVLAAVPLSCLASLGTTVWPHPSSMSLGDTVVLVEAEFFAFSLDGGQAASSEVLRAAVDRYRALIFPRYPTVPSAAAQTSNAQTSNAQHNRAGLSSLTIHVDDASDDAGSLQLGMDESYQLTIEADARAASLKAATVWGALRGLETFSQLVVFVEVEVDGGDEGGAGAAAVDGQYQVLVAPAVIQDTPRFAWRGLLLDTARHYLQLSTIKRTVDAMAYNKLNTLHWHIVDAESFPLVSATFPLLSAQGAYGSKANKHVYTAQQVREVQDYARLRGVRVVLELDTPGHTYSWGLGYPQLTAECPGYSANKNNIPLDPTTNYTYDFVAQLLAEIAPQLDDQYFHVGADEVVYGCWQQDPAIAQYASQHGMTMQDLFAMYLDKLIAIVKTPAVNKSVVAWEDPFTRGIQLPADSVIHVWSDAYYLHDVVSAGYKALLSAGWYLDRQQPLGTYSPTHYMWLDTWKDMYENEPITYGMTPEQEALVIGGEACMFGEQVDDKVVDERIWPRAAAVAERLWSPKSYMTAADAEPRLRLLYCHLSTRGISSSPLNPGPPCVQ